MAILTIISQIILYAIPILFAITLHEFAHGWVAEKLGDPTARMLGRLTLNPIKHIDPVGTIVVPTVLFYLGGFIFGWAKPVPITWQNLKHPKRDMALVAVAGPLANLVMAFAWGIVAKLTLILASPDGAIASYLLGMAKIGVLINFILMVLNMLPVPPLDGSRVLSSFVSPKFALMLAEVEVYGFLILVILLASGLLTAIIQPVIMMFIQLLVFLLQL